MTTAAGRVRRGGWLLRRGTPDPGPEFIDRRLSGFHCHILTHEDAGIMAVARVG